MPSGVPDELFHYTHLGAAQSILAERTIWATNHRFLNDRSELDYALSLMHSAACKEYSKTRTRASEKFISSLRSLIESRLGDMYVASFCADGDLLSQWRSYGNARDAYAVGLSPSTILLQNWHYFSGERDITNHVSLLKVSYNAREIVQFTRFEVAKLVDLIDDKMDDPRLEPSRSVEELLELAKTTQGMEVLQKESEEAKAILDPIWEEIDELAFS